MLIYYYDYYFKKNKKYIYVYNSKSVLFIYISK